MSIFYKFNFLHLVVFSYN